MVRTLSQLRAVTACMLALLLIAALPVPAEARAIGAGRVPRVVARVLPAVVRISTVLETRDDGGNVTQVRGVGSGVIFDRRGYIVTNHHVIDGARDITVSLTDGRMFRATVIGSDPTEDLAVVKIDGQHFQVAALGQSARLALGETVVAIGTPLGIDGGPTVTVGVVSGLGRSMEEPGLPILQNLIQTDAAINPGNSGGPLIDLDGRVVGINTALIPSAHGIGFAIPADAIKPIMRQIITTGRVTRPSLGVVAVSITPGMVSAAKLPVQDGALVVSIEAGVAQDAVLKAGDVITALQGQRVKGLRDLRHALSHRRAGEVVDLSLWRDGQALRIQTVIR
jgi:serine protease Do